MKVVLQFVGKHERDTRVFPYDNIEHAQIRAGQLSRFGVMAGGIMYILKDTFTDLGADGTEDNVIIQVWSEEEAQDEQAKRDKVEMENAWENMPAELRDRVKPPFEMN